MIDGILMLLGIVAIAIVVDWLFTPRAPKPRRVIWRDTDARARQRIADQWTPIMRAEGDWDLVRGEVESDGQ